MTKIITFLTITLFSIGVSAQDAKKESSPAKKTSTTKTMSAADAAKCKAKCKAEGKTAATAAPKKEKKSCCVKA
jgi:hypothetical protein